MKRSRIPSTFCRAIKLSKSGVFFPQPVHPLHTSTWLLARAKAFHPASKRKIEPSTEKSSWGAIFGNSDTSISESKDDEVDEGDDNEGDEESFEDVTATSEEKSELMEDFLRMKPVEFRLMNPMSLYDADYSPLAPGLRWYNLPNVSVIAPMPKTWTIYHGSGLFFGLPLEQYVICHDLRKNKIGPVGHPLHISITKYSQIFTSEIMRPLQQSLQSVAQIFTQLHVLKRGKPGAVKLSPELSSDDSIKNLASRNLLDDLPNSDPMVHPDVIQSWHHFDSRAEMMPGFTIPPEWTKGSVHDTVHVFGLEYSLRHSPVTAENSVDTDKKLSMLSLNEGMRYNVSLMLDPALDSLHEICFSGPSAVWDDIWSSGGDSSLKSIVGLSNSSIKEILDHITIIPSLPSLTNNDDDIKKD
jgi:hypothetical protein